MRNNEILDHLWRLHQNPELGVDPTGNDFARLDLPIKEGQNLQLALLKRWLESGETLGGWKIGMTSGASRNAMGPGVRPFGFILKSRIKTQADSLSVATLCRGQIENEVCFCLGKSLSGEVTAADAKAAVAAVLPAFEVNQKRLPPGSSPGLRVADNLSNWGIVTGASSQPPLSIYDFDQLEVTIGNTQGIIERVASMGHIDNHFESLATLARTLAQHGQTLQSGHMVITGAYGKTAFAPGNYYGDFGKQLGRVEVGLTA